jgi:hypothetical protein
MRAIAGQIDVGRGIRHAYMVQPYMAVRVDITRFP